MMVDLAWTLDSKVIEWPYRWVASGELGAEYVIIPYVRPDAEHLKYYAELSGCREVGSFETAKDAMVACRADRDEWAAP
jgi:hypothetical protein